MEQNLEAQRGPQRAQDGLERGVGVTYLVGVDYGWPAGDITVVVQGERDSEGVVTIHSVRSFIAGTWIDRGEKEELG